MSKSPAHRPALYILRPPSPPALRLDPAAHTPSSFLGRKGRSGSPQVMPDALFSLPAPGEAYSVFLGSGACRTRARKASNA